VASAGRLPEADRHVFREQVRRVERLQRWNEDRMVIVGFAESDPLPRLGAEDTDHCLARLRLKGSFGRYRSPS
jgi:hypothetical protein